MGGFFFTDSMTVDEFHCIKCKEILKPPIILTSMGSICFYHKIKKEDTSSSEEDYHYGLRNTTLERIMKHTTCACRYKERGCEEIVKLHEITEHEECCKFKTFTCLLPGCEWSGIESDYVSHLHKHTDYIDRGSDGMFLLECGTKGTDDVRILRTISGLSLLRVKVLNNKLICAVYDIENRYTESYKIWISCSTSLGKIHNEYPCQIVDSASQFINFESVAGTEIYFDNLNPVNNEDVRVCLKHVFNGETISSEMKDKSKYEGHLELLEEMKIRLPCGNASLGCREQHFPESQHDNTSCYYKKWRCCVKTSCKFKGLFTNLVDHIENNHDSIRHNETTVPLNLNSHKIAFIVYGNIFILKYTYLLNEPIKKTYYSRGGIYCSDGLSTDESSSCESSSDDESSIASYHSCYPQWKWQVLQLTNRSGLTANFGVEVTITGSDDRKLFYLKDEFEKNKLNEDRCELLITNSVLKPLTPQGTKARVRIIKMKK